MEKIIEITGLTKRYKDLVAVNNLHLSVNKGDVFGFLGPNGAGKSTTIRMLMSLIRPTSGSIKIFGQDLQANRIDILRRIGAIVEKPDFYGYLSAYDNLEILARLSGLPPTRKLIMDKLETVGLAQRSKSKVKTFSHGMKQRLGLAQALLHDPDLIILDEPTTGLDPQGMKEIRDLILLLSRQFNKTIFLSSHILYEVELVANRMIIINKGTTVIEGTVAELLSASNIKYTIETNSSDSAERILGQSGFSYQIDSITPTKIILSIEKDKIPELNKMMVQDGLEVYSIIPQHSLEDYFLQLTERSAS